MLTHWWMNQSQPHPKTRRGFSSGRSSTRCPITQYFVLWHDHRRRPLALPLTRVVWLCLIQLHRETIGYIVSQGCCQEDLAKIVWVCVCVFLSWFYKRWLHQIIFNWRPACDQNHCIPSDSWNVSKFQNSSPRCTFGQLTIVFYR